MYSKLIERDSDGLAHIVGLSGGKDSTAMAVRLKELNPKIPYNYICTPTGDELPIMFEHWNNLGEILGKKIIPIMANKTLFGKDGVVYEQKMLPNHRARFCTRISKIEPYKKFLLNVMPCMSYIGLRADEGERKGADYDDDQYFSVSNGFDQTYPMREWGWTVGDVYNYLQKKCIDIPERTDCARCFFQTIGEWWRLWKDNNEAFVNAVNMEKEFGYTFRTRKFDRTDKEKAVPIMITKRGHTYQASHRDSWPAWLEDLGIVFNLGNIPKGADQIDMLRGYTCRVCTL